MRRLKHSLILVSAIGILCLCADNASAQIPPSGYIFLEVTDTAEKPVFSAAAVVYDQAGNEVASSITDREGTVNLLMNRNDKKKFGFRVIKSGFLTYEGVFETSGEYINVRIKVRLIPASRPKEGKVPETLPPPTTKKPKKRNYHAGKSTHFAVLPISP